MIFTETTLPPAAKNRMIEYAALVYAAILVVMVVAQLFKFEEFVPLIASFGLGGGEPRAMVIASVLVIAEVFALPFLLRMYLSPLMRTVSMALGWAVAGLWLYLMVGLSLTVNAVGDSGFLGTALTVSFGWWSVVLTIFLAALAIWVSWGMWPLAKNRTSPLS